MIMHYVYAHLTSTVGVVQRTGGQSGVPITKFRDALSPRNLITGGRKVIKRAMPLSVRTWLRRKELLTKHLLLPLRKVRDFGQLSRVTPISRDFGWTRGTPIDRYYIEQFLSRHATDIQGRVAEFQTDLYTSKFGAGRVIQSDVIHDTEGNPFATIVADIAGGARIPSSSFDCVLCTQVLLLVYDFRSAIQTLYRILKPGGVLLITVPGIGHKLVSDDPTAAGDFWRFTTISMRRLLQEVFPPDRVQVQSYGNVLAAVALLHGLAVEELEPDALEHWDPEFEVSIAVRAVKPELM
jgi:SAM-dependent methyltransferase